MAASPSDTVPNRRRASRRTWLRFLTVFVLIGAGGLAVVFYLRGAGTESTAPSTAAMTPPWFEDATARANIRFNHSPGPVPGSFSLPQINGSGCAMTDLDGDGRPDILLLTHGGPTSTATNALYHQNPDGTFEDVSHRSGLDFASFAMGTAIGDVNNDGKPDVLITLYGGIRLFENLGNMKFRELKDSGAVSRGWATSCCFLDYDRDGRLDFVVVHGVDVDPSWSCTEPDGNRGYCSPNVFPGSVSRLFHNESDARGVRFRDVSVKSGVGRLPGPGLGVACADFNNDGWPDIFIANDARPNRLWINKHDGTFSEEAAARGVALNNMGLAWAGMGVALGDVNDDNRIDILVSHLGIETNTLWLQERDGFFQDRTMSTGLVSGEWRGTGWGVTLSDFDHDGRLDSAVVNGRVNRGPPTNSALGEFWSPYAERNQLFAGVGSGQFRDRSKEEPAFCGTPNVARGLAVADYDRDGALDMLITAVGGRARLFRNVCPLRGNWLVVRCVLPQLGGRDAIGAVVTVKSNGRSWTRCLGAGESFLSSSEPETHFGLGTLKTVDSIDVRWPDGSHQVFPGVATNQAVTLKRSGE
jgi:hypothetical protein